MRLLDQKEATGPRLKLPGTDELAGRRDSEDRVKRLKRLPYIELEAALVDEEVTKAWTGCGNETVQEEESPYFITLRPFPLGMSIAL